MASNLKSIIAFRKKLHTHPELSGEELNTASLVRERLAPLEPDELFTIGKTGLAAVFKGKEPGPSVLIRSELDALPIEETNDFPHKSTQSNVSHKCGHDGHTAVLVGLAEKVKEKPLTKGRVILLFQPAEETGEGARAVLADPKFSEIEPDYVFAMHNLPGFPQNVAIIKPGAFTAAVCTLILKLKGKSAHAAEPENGTNPIYAIQEILRKARELENPDQTRPDFNLITPVFCQVGQRAYGTAPGKGEIHFTIRAWESQELELLLKKLTDWALVFALGNGIELEFTRAEEFRANVNDMFAIDLLREAAKENNLAISRPPLPFKWGEDFGLFTENYRGAIFGMGAGENWPALHNPDYDFPDEIITPGISMFHSIIKRILN